MSILDTKLAGVKTVLILGHVHPDGDCIGSCLGLYNYLKEVYPHLELTLCLEEPPQKFSYLQNFDQIRTEFVCGKVLDLCICLDCSSEDRLGEGGELLAMAKDSLCIDHHVTNTGYAGENVVEPDASSTSEVLYGLFEESRITREIAECLYTGIIHDTGVFKYSCTSPKTMRIAAKLMETGIEFNRIIDESFYRKTYVQNQILGRALLESITFLDGACVFSVVRLKDMKFYGVTSKDLDGIVEKPSAIRSASVQNKSWMWQRLPLSLAAAATSALQAVRCRGAFTMWSIIFPYISKSSLRNGRRMHVPRSNQCV